jgi:hypothetical protein
MAPRPPIQAVIETQAELDEGRRYWRMALFNEDGTPFLSEDGLLGPNTMAAQTDVDLTGLGDGDILVWDATTSKWIRAAAPSGGGVSDTDTWHAIGDSGEPAFGAGWSNSAADMSGDDPGTRPGVAFRKIPGAVAVRGVVAGSYGTPIFTLPAGYRPSATHVYMAPGAVAPSYRLHIEPNGQVLFADGPTTTPTWLNLATIIPLDPA